MPSLNPAKCKVGDVVLFYEYNLVGVGQGLVKGLKTLTILPAVVSVARGGSTAFRGAANANHAAIITGIEGRRVFSMVHATNSGVQSVDIDMFLLGASGALQLFRQKGQFDFAAEAGKVGATWAMAAEESPGGMPYATSKAFCSVLQGPSFGSGAKQRAAFYRQSKDRQGGPADLANMRDGRSKAMFCSMFVIACYQAVMSDMYCEQMLALDAKHTSPMYLDGYFKNSQHWERVDGT